MLKLTFRVITAIILLASFVALFFRLRAIFTILLLIGAAIFYLSATDKRADTQPGLSSKRSDWIGFLLLWAAPVWVFVALKSLEGSGQVRLFITIGGAAFLAIAGMVVIFIKNLPRSKE